MRILLLGKDGQLGRSLQRSLPAIGEVIALGRDSVAPLVGDLTDLGGLEATVRAARPDLIVNAAAHTAVDQSERDPSLAFQVNAEGPAALARQASRLGAWLMHYSTDYVFDGTGSEPHSEQSPTRPLNVHGRSKLAGEEAIRAAGSRHLILRTSWVYSARGSNFAKTMLRLARERGRLTVVDDQIGAPTGADLIADLSARCALAVQRDGKLAGTYNAAANGATSWHGYASHVIETARRAGAKIHVGSDAIEAIPSSDWMAPALRPKNSRLDTTKLRTAFGICLPDWRQGVDRMLLDTSA